MQSVAITPGGGVRRELKQIANFFKSILMPNLQDYHLALLLGQARQAVHRCLFVLGFRRGTVEPAFRFQFTGEPAPEGPAIVQGAVAERADAIMIRLVRRLWTLHEDHERFLEDVSGFRVG